MMVLLHIYSESLGVRLPVCPVNKKYSFDAYQILSSIQGSLIIKAN